MSTMFRRIHDRVRTMFGIRQARRRLPTGHKPKIGGLVVKGQRSIDITHVLTDEQWGWFVLMGWSAVDRRKERRTYYPLPKQACELLVRSSAVDRELLLERLLKQ